MNNHTITGINDADAIKMAGKLNQLLANYSVFHMNLRGLHWNICCRHFFRLHKEYEKEYLDAYAKIDVIAERVRQFSGTPYSTFKDYEKYSTIKSIETPIMDESGVEKVLEAYQVIFRIEAEIMELTEEIKDYGTNDLIAGYMREQAKRVWMFNAFLAHSCARPND